MQKKKEDLGWLALASQIPQHTGFAGARRGGPSEPRDYFPAQSPLKGGGSRGHGYFQGDVSGVG